jgi:hypothetical protein
MIAQGKALGGGPIIACIALKGLCGSRRRPPSGLKSHDVMFSQGCALGFHSAVFQALTRALGMNEINQCLHVINRRLLQHAMAEVEDVAGAVVGGVEDRAGLGFDRLAIG